LIPGLIRMMFNQNKTNPANSFVGQDDLAQGSEFYNIPLLGEVCEEGSENIITGSGERIRNFPENDPGSIALRALDDGLRSDGVLKGDLLTIALKDKWRDGDIVAVRLGSRIYIRRLFRDRRHIRLESTEPSAATLVVETDTPGFEIIGKVAAVFREL
jgi:repressor LexA